jgi:hypothetical protein
MNRVWVAAALAAAAAIGCGKTAAPPAAPQGASAAAEQKGQELGYKVKWPTEPSFQAGKGGLDGKATETHDASASARGQGWLLNYQVSVARYPASDEFDKVPPKERLRAYIAPLAKLDQNVTTKDIEFGPKKYPALEVTGERAGAQVRQVVVLVGRDIYSATVSGTPAKVNGPEGDEFIKSFEVLK